LLDWNSRVDPEAEHDATIWVQWQHRGERSWHGLAVGLCGKEARISVQHLPGGPVRFRLLLHDGFSTASADSEFMNLPQRGPHVAIMHPLENSEFTPDQPVMAWVSTHGHDGTEIPEGQINWLLDGKPVGSGTQRMLPLLERGNHSLEVIVKDNQGQSS